jgi:peptide/nickel transport system permease protein
LDQSVWHRLAAYLASLVQGNLGWSVSFNRPILGVILERLPNTLLLMGAATALSFAVGTLLGLVAGARPGSFRDRFLSITSLVLYAIPGFWLETSASGKQGLARAGDIALHLVLPVVSLALIYLALYLRVMRAAMADIWRMDFVRALRARGISRPRIVLRHVARNALLPLGTLLGLQAASMLGGSVVIESVFAVPGLGRLAQEAVASRDTPLLLGVILTSAIMVIVVNFLVDLLYVWLDPRIAQRAAGKARA